MTGLLHERSPEQVALDQQVLARVKAGMALLEERYGPEWVEQIDLGQLDLREGDSCILGQVYGGYGDGLQALGFEDGSESDRLGFSIYGASMRGWWPGEEDDGWALLQRTWERELRPLIENP